jgi:hypothetical protein
MTDDWDRSAWLTPWQAVQLVVSHDSRYGSKVAKKIPEVKVKRTTYLGAFLDLHRTHPVLNRAVGLFRRAIEKVDEWSRSGRIEAKSISEDGQVRLVGTVEFSAHSINFNRGTFKGEQLRLKRDDLIQLCAPPPSLKPEVALALTHEKETTEAPERRPISASGLKKVPAYLKDLQRGYAAKGKRLTERLAWRETEDHFQRRIGRDQFRRLWVGTNVAGPVGRPRKEIPPKSTAA